MRAAPPPRARGSAPGQESVRSQIDHVMGLMADGNAAAASGDYASALDSYSAIVQRYPELALAERARVTRAQLLYQVSSLTFTLCSCSSLCTAYALSLRPAATHINLN